MTETGVQQSDSRISRYQGRWEMLVEQLSAEVAG
jgi:hypothetical protein